MSAAARPLEGRVALVTGAAQGVGAEVARRLHSEGAKVAVNDLLASDRLRSVAEPIGALEAVADVSDPGAVAATAALVERELGPIDILVSNAALETMGDFVEQSTGDFWGQIEVNLSGAMYWSREVLPGMVSRGNGRIVAITSVAGVNGWAKAVGYSASKAGLIGLVRALAREAGPSGVRVNGIAPGAIDSPQIEVDAEHYGVTLDALRERYVEMTPLGRIAQPADIAGLVALLAGPAGESYSGQILQPNGGIERASA